MSVPILYNESNNDYSTLGLGLLNEASSVLAVRHRNQFPYLTFNYPINGKLFSQLKEGRK